ncbi:MAG: LysR substrate-binding domain-containing protein [Pseudomonadota bacterium]
MNLENATSPLEAGQLKNLRIFACVADTGSIARAAELLFKAPSAITRSIIEFERCVGMALFERKPRGMLLNAYGDAVLIRGRRIQDEVQLAAADFLRSAPASYPASPTVINNLLFDGRKLQFLIRLTDSRNISTAAAQMRMTQAGASMALSRIEAGLGHTLFRRMMQGMVATDVADRLTLRAKRILAELRHIGSDISAIAGKIRGSVVIGTLPLGRTFVFPTAIARALADFPGLRVSTIESPYEQLISGLRNGDIDVVFGALRPTDLYKGLTTEPLFTDRLGVIVRSGHPLAKIARLQMTDLMSEKWILPKSKTPGRPLVDSSFQNLGLQAPTASVETADLAILRQLLIASDMLAVTSPHQLMFEIRSGLLAELPVALGKTTREIGLILREGAMASPAIAAVLDAVRRQVREHHSECFGPERTLPSSFALEN